MRTASALLTAILLFVSAPAQCRDIRHFATWVRSVVTVMYLDEANIVTIRVKDSFTDENVPDVYRTSLPGVMICTQFEDELEKRDFLEARVYLPDRNGDDFAVMVHIPGRANTCSWW